MAFSPITIGIDCALRPANFARVMHFPTPAVFPMLAQAASNTPDPQTGPNPAASGIQLVVALAIIFLLAVGVQIIANWVISKILASDNSQFSKAVKLFFMTLAGLVGTAVLAAVVIAGGTALEIPSLNIVAAVGSLLLVLYVVFATPMNVYKIGFLRSVLFVVLAAVIASAGNFAAIIGLGIMLKDTDTGAAFRAIQSRDPAVQGAGLAWLRKAVPSLSPALDATATRTAGDRSQPVEVRRAALHVVRDGLEARRVALDLKDAAAVAAYKREAEEYSKWVHELEVQGARPIAKP
jgi:hypothetical protein